jgi:hypothetical protein
MARRIASLLSRLRAVAARHRSACLWAGIALVSGALLFARLGDKCLWGDEVASLYYSSALARTVQDLRHPPLYYALLYAWARLFGPGEVTLRVLSALCGFGVVMLTVAAGRYVGSPGVVWRAGLLIATSPLLILYARMLRGYALTTGLALGATLFFLAAVRQPASRRVWVGYALTVLALLYADYTTTASVLAAHSVGLMFLTRSRSADHRQLRRRWAYSLTGVIAGSLPILVNLLRHAQRAGQTGGLTADLARAPLGAAMKLAYPLLTFATGETIGIWRWWLLVPVVGLYAFLLLRALRARGSATRDSVCIYALVLGSVLIVNAAILSLSTLATHIPVQHASRLALAGFPFFVVLAALGIDRISRPAARAAVLAALLATNGLAVSNYFGGREFHNPNWDLPWRDVVGQVRAQARPGEILVTFELAFLYYYYGGTPGRADFMQALSGWWTNKPSERDGILVWGMPRRPDARQLETYLRAPGVWLVRRDRGAAAQRRFAEATRSTLAAHYGRLVETGFAPVDPAAARLRAAVLSRPTWPSAIYVDHFTERRPAGSDVDADPAS